MTDHTLRTWRWNKPEHWATFCRCLLQAGVVERKSQALKLWNDSVRNGRAVRVERGVHRLRRNPDWT